MSDSGNAHTSEALWLKLERTADAFATPAESAPTREDEAEDGDKSAKKRRLRRARQLLDAVSVVFWSYVVLKIFVVDLDRLLFENLAPSMVEVLHYRAFFYLAVLIVAVATLRRSWAYIAYVVLFPLVTLLWKFPRAIWRRKSWLVVVGLVHAVSGVLTDFRFNFVSKGLAAFSMLAITLSVSTPVVLAASSYLLVLLGVSFWRAIRASVSPSRFLQRQDRLVNFLMEKLPFDVNAIAAELETRDVEVFNKAELDKFTTALNVNVAVNRCLYFWAYQLDQYRSTPATIAFSGLRYTWLFLGATVSLTAVNLGILHVDPSQFAYSRAPSVLAMALYSMSTLALNAGAGIDAAGDWAIAIRLLAGFIGVVFLATLLVNFILSYRREQEDVAIQSTVQALKERASEHERRLKATLDVSIEEAIGRLDRLGANLASLIAVIMTKIPNDFYDTDGDKGR